ncbi:DNA-binding response regulator [Virgisporangium aurantiacum]|uniref:DNA-binding response regulator n=2 Tax=Virgisporangium aurantiacum TaxID=175570 RepID=A0A8J4DZP5_9ACTN|nr:DNA-binding response regulator [Virgisporangium aurantiacum]
MIRVLMLEDGQWNRAGFSTLLNREPDIALVATADIELEIAPLAAQFAPDVVLVNTDLMVSQILPKVAELKSAAPKCAVIVLCDPTKRGMLPPRRRARRVSFVVKDTSVRQLAAAIRHVARGERVVDPRLEVAAISTEKAVSTREWEVLGLAAEGETVAEIARRLYLSLGTVRNHISSVITKTGARNRLDAIRIARKDGWLR